LSDGRGKSVSSLICPAYDSVDSRDQAISPGLSQDYLRGYLLDRTPGADRPGDAIVEEVSKVLLEIGPIMSNVIYVSLNIVAVGLDRTQDKVTYGLQCDKVDIVREVVAVWLPATAIGPKAHFPQLTPKIQTGLIQVGFQRMNSGPEVGRIRQVARRALTARDSG